MSSSPAGPLQLKPLKSKDFSKSGKMMEILLLPSLLGDHCELNLLGNGEIYISMKFKVTHNHTILMV